MAATDEDQGEVALADGRLIRFRPIQPTDMAALQRFHRRLSERSVRARFFRSLPALSDADARRFTHLDGVDRFALVALAPEEPTEIIAVVRLERDAGTA